MGITIEIIKKSLSSVLVGKIISIDRHPNADRLLLVDLDIGTGILKIVTGAPNLSINDVVLFIKAGTVLPAPLLLTDETKILEPRNLRGFISDAMLLAEDELCFSNDHTGVLLLNKLDSSFLLGEFKLGNSILENVSDLFLDKIYQYITAQKSNLE